MSKSIKYHVRLHPDVLKHYDSLIDEVITKGGLVSCYDIRQNNFLEMDAMYHREPDPKYTVKLLIPYSYILYIVSSDDVDLDKIPGFRNTPKE